MHLALVLGVFAVGQALESFILTPWLVGDRIGLHPVAVIFAIMAGGKLFGFLGVLLALPVAALAMVMLRYAHQQYTHSQIVWRRTGGCRFARLAGHRGARPARPRVPPSPRPGPTCESADSTRAEVSSRPAVRGLRGAGRAPRAGRGRCPRRSKRLAVSGRTGAAAARRICNWRHAPRPAAGGMSASYLPLASMAGRMRDALVGQDGAELVCLDGLEAIAGNAKTRWRCSISTIARERARPA